MLRKASGEILAKEGGGGIINYNYDEVVNRGNEEELNKPAEEDGDREEDEDRC